MANFFFIFLWGLVVLAGFIGWGALVARLAGFSAKDAPDWGLAAGWGMAGVATLGGVLTLLGVATAPVLFGVVGLGVVLFGAAVIKTPFVRVDFSEWSGAGLTGALITLALAVLLLRYGSYISFIGFNCSDDDIVYFTFVTRLLETGTLIEPFSLRRLSAFGGHTVLQSLVMMAGTDVNGFLLDRGIAVIVVFGLTTGFLRRAGMEGAAPYMVALIVTVIMPVIMPFRLGNSSSHVTGMVLFLTLFRSMQPMPLGSPSVKGLWLIGLVAAAASSLKAHYLGVAAITVLFYWLALVFDGWRTKSMSLVMPLVHLGLSALVFLAPWMALLYRSSATILFPLFQGNHQPGFAATYSGRFPLPDLLAFVGKFLIAPQISLLLVPVVLCAFYRDSRAGMALYGAAVIMSVVTAATLTYDSIETLHRYVAPFLGAALIATVSVFLGRLHRPLVFKAGPLVLCILAVLLAPVSVYRDFNRLIDQWGVVNLGDKSRDAYKKMQAAVPSGKKFMAVLAHPFALDYRRNVVFNIDVPGGASRKPGMPFFKGSKALKQYLLGQSIRHIAYRDFTNPGGCLYYYSLWKLKTASGHPMWTAQAKYYLDLMKNIEALEKTQTVIYRGRVLRVMRLQ
ncbi:MAG: hypothetical protein V3R37_06400 [Rhodospirillales bacterium]